MKSLVVLVALSLVSFSVSARPAYLKKFKATYPQSKTAEASCLVCHANEDDYERNAYGQDVENNNIDFKAIEGFDSDADGFTNIDEINAGTLPGDKDSRPLPVNKLPTAMLTCLPSGPYKIECNANGSQDLDGKILSYKYILDDGVIVENTTPASFTHTFLTLGSHSFSLIVTDNDGGTNEIKKDYIVNQNTLPIVEFKCEPNYLPLQIKCSSTSYDLDVGDQIVEYSWSIGENEPLKTTIPSFETAVLSAGVYNVKLEVKDSSGGISALTQSFTIL